VAAFYLLPRCLFYRLRCFCFALEALLHKGALTISEIQDKVRLASGSMTAAVDRLEKLGLVVRKSSPIDRRARVVHLTAEGKRLVVSCFERHAKDLVADVRAQVALSMWTDFENFTTFKPHEQHDKAVHLMADEVIAWGEALKPLRATH
jgi:DNA-binding MarR family transcriptional regulator